METTTHTKPNAMRLRRLRKGRSLQQIADLMGVAVSTVADWETGKKRPLDARIARLAKAYGYTEATLRRRLREARSDRLAKESTSKDPSPH